MTTSDSSGNSRQPALPSRQPAPAEPESADKPLSGTAGGLPGSQHGRMEFIDGIRALAAIFVVFHHAYYEPTNGLFNNWLVNHVGLSYGHLAVDVFIVLSGFCLTLPAARCGLRLPSLKIYFVQRFRRILPPYYAALALTCAYIAFFAHQRTLAVWDTALPMTWSTVVGHLLLLQDMPYKPFHVGNLDYPMWSIAVEFHIYFLMPLILLSLRRLKPAATMLLTLAAGESLHFLWPASVDDSCPWYIGLFTFGCVAANASQHADARSIKRWKACAAVLGGAALLYCLKAGVAVFRSHEWSVDIAVGAAFALYLAALMSEASGRGSKVVAALSWKPLVNVGVYSYSLYLVHAPVLHVLDRTYATLLHPAGIPALLLLIASLPIILAASYLFHLAFERPFMRKAKPAPPCPAPATIPAPDNLVPSVTGA